MFKPTAIATAPLLALVLALGSQAALAAPDWAKVPSKKITLFYPGTAAFEWVSKAADHSGAKGLKKGETCAGCHDEEIADIGQKVVSGEKLEPYEDVVIDVDENYTGAVIEELEAQLDPARFCRIHRSVIVNLSWVGETLDRCPNFYVDISARIAELGRQPYSARRFFLKYPDRILVPSLRNHSE